MLRRVGTVLALVFAVLLGGVLFWPDGSLVNRGVVEVYVVLLDAGVPAGNAWGDGTGLCLTGPSGPEVLSERGRRCPHRHR